MTSPDAPANNQKRRFKLLQESQMPSWYTGTIYQAAKFSSSLEEKGIPFYHFIE